jgi:membrane associated rhomboid family serine protease
VVRTQLGGRVTDGRPLVTMSIIAVCVVSWLVDWTGLAPLTNWFSFYPAGALVEPWRFITSAFLHSTTFLPHIAMNMYALWLVGPYLEGLLGRWRFTALYLLSGIAGSVGFYVLASTDPESWWGGAVGASGAVFGLFSALLIIHRRLKRDSTQIFVVILINGAFSFIPGIAWQAHLGGLIAGAAIAGVFTLLPRNRNGLWQIVGLAGVFLILLLAVAAKAATVPAALLYLN